MSKSDSFDSDGDLSTVTSMSAESRNTMLPNLDALINAMNTKNAKEASDALLAINSDELQEEMNKLREANPKLFNLELREVEKAFKTLKTKHPKLKEVAEAAIDAGINEVITEHKETEVEGARSVSHAHIATTRGAEKLREAIAGIDSEPRSLKQIKKKFGIMAQVAHDKSHGASEFTTRGARGEDGELLNEIDPKEKVTHNPGSLKDVVKLRQAAKLKEQKEAAAVRKMKRGEALHQFAENIGLTGSLGANVSIAARKTARATHDYVLQPGRDAASFTAGKAVEGAGFLARKGLQTARVGSRMVAGTALAAEAVVEKVAVKAISTALHTTAIGIAEALGAAKGIFLDAPRAVGGALVATVVGGVGGGAKLGGRLVQDAGVSMFNAPMKLFDKVEREWLKKTSASKEASFAKEVTIALGEAGAKDIIELRKKIVQESEALRKSAKEMDLKYPGEKAVDLLKRGGTMELSPAEKVDYDKMLANNKKQNDLTEKGKQLKSNIEGATEGLGTRGATIMNKLAEAEHKFDKLKGKKDSREIKDFSIREAATKRKKVRDSHDSPESYGNMRANAAGIMKRAAAPGKATAGFMATTAGNYLKRVTDAPLAQKHNDSLKEQLHTASQLMRGMGQEERLKANIKRENERMDGRVGSLTDSQERGFAKKAGIETAIETASRMAGAPIRGVMKLAGKSVDTPTPANKRSTVRGGHE